MQSFQFSETRDYRRNAQRIDSAVTPSLTRKRSLIRSQYRPPAAPQVRGHLGEIRDGLLRWLGALYPYVYPYRFSKTSVDGGGSGWWMWRPEERAHDPTSMPAALHGMPPTAQKRDVVVAQIGNRRCRTAVTPHRAITQRRLGWAPVDHTLLLGNGPTIGSAMTGKNLSSRMTRWSRSAR